MRIPVIDDAKEGNDRDVDDPIGQWIILFPEDYENFMMDADDNLAFSVQSEQQARELERLASQAVEWFQENNLDGDADGD
jgi:hypothetical protein